MRWRGSGARTEATEKKGSLSTGCLAAAADVGRKASLSLSFFFSLSVLRGALLSPPRLVSSLFLLFRPTDVLSRLSFFPSSAQELQRARKKNKKGKEAHKKRRRTGAFNADSSSRFFAASERRRGLLVCSFHLVALGGRGRHAAPAE